MNIVDAMREMTLIQLIEQYGAECVYGGQGGQDNSEEFLTEIKRRLAAGEVE